MLHKHIESMNTVIKSVRPKDGHCPPKLEEQLGIFNKYVHIQNIYSRVVVLTYYRGYRNVESVTAAVERLKGNVDDPTTEKIMRGASQALRKDKITEELDGYIKSLSWCLDCFTVRVGSGINRSGTS